MTNLYVFTAGSLATSNAIVINCVRSRTEASRTLVEMVETIGEAVVVDVVDLELIFQFNSIQFMFNPSISKKSLMVTQPSKYMQKEPTDILYQKINKNRYIYSITR